MSIEITIPAYHLERDDLRRFLEWRFPGHRFTQELVLTGETYLCVIPTNLNEEDWEDIKKLIKSSETPPREFIIKAAGTCRSIFEEVISLLESKKVPLRRRLVEHQQERFQSWANRLELLAKAKGAWGSKITSLPEDIQNEILVLLRITERNLSRIVDLESPKATPRDIQHWKLPNVSWLGLKSLFRPPSDPVAVDLDSLSKTCLDIIEESIGRLIDLIETLYLHPNVAADYGRGIDVEIPHIKDGINEPIEGKQEKTLRTLKLRGLISSRFPKLHGPLMEHISASIEARGDRMMQQALREAPQSSSTTYAQPKPPVAENLQRSQVTPLTTGIYDQSDDYIEPTSIQPRHSDHPDLYKYPEPLGRENADFGGSLSCRFCFRNLEPKDLEVSSWRRHVLADIEPYVCILDDCPTPMTLFPSFREWKNHMNLIHDTQWLERLQSDNMWYCDVEPSEHSVFLSAADLERHVKLDHGGRVPTITLATMLKQNVTLASRGQNYCPICDELVDPADYGQESNIDAGSMGVDRPGGLALTESSSDDAAVSEEDFIIQHIAEDLRKLSFLSFQYLDDETTRQVVEQSPQSPGPVAETVGGYSTYLQGGARSNLDDIEQLPDLEIDDKSQSEEMKQPPEPPKARSLKELRRLIHSSQQESVFDARRFLPRDVLTELINTETIKFVLNDGSHVKSGPDLQELAEFIASKARAFFAILVSVVQPRELFLATSSLHRHNLTDHFLPISDEMIDDNCEEDDNYRTCSHAPELKAFHEEPWDLLLISSFHLKQWEFLAPVFNKHVRIYNFSPRMILPFVDMGIDRKSGLFSDVCEVKIHSAHQELDAKTDIPATQMALKEIRTLSSSTTEAELQKTFDLEISIMSRILGQENLVVAVAAIRRGGKHYLLYPWADGGDLRSFWSQMETSRSFDSSAVLEVLDQLLGLAQGLEHLHDNNVRHGDIKPDNILRFTKEKKVLGRLKLGDMGLAKYHQEMTQERVEMTTTKFTTVLYEAPEAHLDREAPMSRLYDIWSLGCVFFEFAIWLACGLQGLNTFYDSLGSERRFFHVRKDVGIARAQISPQVKEILEELRHHPSFGKMTALGDLVQFVEARMLAIYLPASQVKDGKESYSAASINDPPMLRSTRADAKAVSTILKQICGRARADPDYLLPGGRIMPQSLTSKLGVLKRSDSLGLNFPTDELRPYQEYARPGLNSSENSDIKDAWDFIIDNKFAEGFLARLDKASTHLLANSYETPDQPRICEECKGINFDDTVLKFVYPISYLEENANNCDLCNLFHKAALASHLPAGLTIQFVRNKSVLTSGVGGLPILSLVSSPDSDISMTSDIQIGFPLLPENEISSKLARHWLDSCDMHHSCNGRPADNMPPRRLPTRLLNLGSTSSSIVKLQTTADMDPALKYIALSFVWGSNVSRAHEGLTFPHNISDYEQGIDSRKLPKTCRDAIVIVRQLGIQYLWIDSLCIIQGPGGDFAEEAQIMESIYHNAYCVLAACSSSSILEGFLETRQQRSVVPVTSHEGKAIFLCEFIDNFEHDVDLSPLFSRGWAFQERILARRMIFFTSKQMYWQCGEGVRCETLTKMSNLRASFYGSPDFPASILSKIKISPVSLFKDLYTTFSRLQFSRWSDRPLAIRGLEMRLFRETGCKGQHGIVLGKPEYLGQTLLWRAATDDGMYKILFPPTQDEPPSWSWMAYSGEINYLDVRPGEVEWDSSISMLVPEVSPDEPAREANTPISLSAPCFDFNKAEKVEARYDRPEDAAQIDQKCVIVGRTPGSNNVDSTFYLLLIARRGSAGTYTRIGIALAEGKALFLKNPSETVVIV